MYATAWNPGVSPVVVDDEGRTIGGSEWGTVETTSDAVKTLLAVEALMLVDEPKSGADVNPALSDALARTAERKAAADALRGEEKPDLVALAEEHAPSLADAHKGDIVDGLAARGVAPEENKTPGRKAAGKTTTTSERA